MRLMRTLSRQTSKWETPSSGYVTRVGRLWTTMPRQNSRTRTSTSKSMRRPMVSSSISRSTGGSGYTRKPHIESRIANDKVLIHTQTWVR